MKALVFAAALFATAAANAQTCSTRTDEQLKEMSDADLRAAYCTARASSAAAKPVLPAYEPGKPMAAPKSNACLTETLQLVRTMEARKIDVGDALQACGKAAGK